MDELRFGQLLHRDITDKRKRAILEELNVESTVSGKCSKFSEKSALLGYNCLHIAATISDVKLVKKLLDLGVNVLQQGDHDGKTPLHVAVDCSKHEISVWNSNGVLLNRSLIDVLLSAIMKIDSAANVRCKSGVSHLHIACMFNNAEAVLFLAKPTSLDQSINTSSKILPGYTPLHCAIRYSAPEAATLLLTLGADIYRKNVKGINSVIFLINRLLYVNDFLNLRRGSSERYTYDREIERLDLILKTILLKSERDHSKLIENTGLSIFHLSCILKDNWIMQSYMKTKNAGNINEPATCKSEFYTGWTPLHFAACFNIQSFEILLDNGADIKSKNANGETAFDLCIQRHEPGKLFPHFQYHRDHNPILSVESKTLSDLIFAMSKNSFFEFLQNLEDIDITVPLESPCWPGCNLLHMSMSTNRRVKFPQVFFQKVHRNSDIHLFPDRIQLPSTEGRVNNNWDLFGDSLNAGCSIYAKNADGLTPVHLAYRLQEWHMLDLLLIRANENAVGPDNVSFLHIACVMGKKDVIEHLIEQGADVNSAVTRSLDWYAKAKTYAEMSDGKKTLIRANSTPLHIAVIFKMEEAVEKLLDYQADIQAQDELGLTPLHLSLASTKRIAQLLMSEATELRDDRREDGVSYLHVAAFADDEKAVRRLLRDGSDVNGFIKNTAPKCFEAFAGMTPLHLSVEGGGKVARSLIYRGANIVAENPYSNNETPLDLLMRLQLNSSEVNFPFDKLKLKKIKTDALTASGLTTLHFACATLDVDWTRSLLERGANPNAQTSDDQGKANTPMHLLIAKAASAPNLPANFRLIVELLVNHGADVNISNNSETPLHSIASLYFDKKCWPNTASDKAVLLTIGDGLLSGLSSYAFNHVDANGFSYLHLACVTNNLAVINNYLNSGVDINHSTSPFLDYCGGCTPLHFAIPYKNMDVVQLLLERGANVNAENRYGHTPLHLAVIWSLDLQLIDALLRKGADINVKNAMNRSPLLCLIHQKNISYEKINFFVSRGAFIDITEATCDGQGIIGFATGNAMPSDVDLIFKIMSEAFKVENAITRGFRAIHSIVTVKQNKHLTREYYLKAIQKLVEKGSDIDEEDSNGKRALERAIQFCNCGAIEALLLLGAMLNIRDNEYDYYCAILKACDLCAFMKKYLWKMSLLKLDCHTTNPYFAKYYQRIVEDRSFQPIELEKKKTKNKKICGTLSANDFLSEWGAVIQYPSMSSAKRQTVDNFFKRSDDLMKEFPELSGILTMQYRKAVARVKLMQPVKNILIDAGIDLPDLCLDAILKYFKNSELDCWIEEANETPQPRKRQRIH